MLKFNGTVLNASIEERELVDKNGARAVHKIGHVLMSTMQDKVTCILNIRAFDIKFDLPEVGKQWTTPNVRQYTCYDGQVAEVSV